MMTKVPTSVTTVAWYDLAGLIHMVGAAGKEVTRVAAPLAGGQGSAAADVVFFAAVVVVVVADLAGFFALGRERK